MSQEEHEKSGIMKAVIQAELEEIAEKAKELKKLRDGAKSEYKRKFYEKKQKKHSNRAVEMLVAFNKLEQRDIARGKAPVDLPDIPGVPNPGPQNPEPPGQGGQPENPGQGGQGQGGNPNG
jgi:hypothetical protein